MTQDICDVQARHLVTLLGASTFSIGCVHSTLAMVTYSFIDRTIYLTLLVENVDIGFRFDANGAKKIMQGVHLPTLAEEPPDGQQASF